MELTKIIRKKYKAILLGALAFLAAALIVTFVQPLKYRAQAKVLIVQQFEKNSDPYNASKMNEYLGGLLAEVVSSESFFNQAVKPGNNIDLDYFSGSRQQQLSRWAKTAQAKSLFDSGIIISSAYHPNKDQAAKIAQATIYTLKTTNSFYHSLPNVDVRIIDSPSVSLLPVKPNIILNAVLAVLLGVIFGLLYGCHAEPDKLLNKIKSML